MFIIAVLLTEIDFQGGKSLPETGRINCVGRSRVPENWQFSRYKGINRLYYIESDGGAYMENGVKHNFTCGHIYFFPYTAEYDPVRPDCVGMMHTYADFELIPPVIHSMVIELSPPFDPLVKAALGVFTAAGDYYGKAKSKGGETVPVTGEWAKLSRTAIAFLADRAAKSVGAAEISDSVVIKSLEIMNRRMGEKITVSGIAAECFMTTDSFIRRFTRTIGATPYSYLKNLRLRTALYLRSSGKSLDETAAETGYSDSSALLHAMKGKWFVESKTHGV